MACSHAATTPVVQSRDRASGEVFDAVRCAECGLVVTQPLPADLGPYYSAGTYHAHRPSRDSPIERLRQWTAARYVYRPISRRTPGKLLDVGCGTGRLAFEFIRLGWEVYGVEPSRQARALAARRGVIVQGSSLTSATGRFDAIVFNHSLEHIPDPDLALKTARSLLASGAMIGVAVPDFGSWQRRLFGPSWLQLDMPRHVNHFERNTLDRLIRDAGFDPIRVRRTPFLPTLVESAGIHLPHRAQQLLKYAIFPPQLLVPGDCLNVVAVAQ